MFFRYFRPLDYVVFATAAVFTASLSVNVYGGPGDSGFAIEGMDGQLWRFPLKASETVYVRGPLGETCVEISGGGARIVSSPCPNKSCVAQGAVRLPAQFAVCLPNKVVVRLKPREGDAGGVDAASW